MKLQTLLFMRNTLLVIAISILSACGSGSGSSGDPISSIDDEPDEQTPVGFSLVPVSSAQSFEDYIKLGLSQWAGTVNSPRASSLSSRQETSADSQMVFSELNVQVDGVDEADITRFDGDYLYIADGNKIDIVSTDNENASATLVNTLDLQSNVSVTGLYLVADDQQTTLLAVVASDYSYQWLEDSENPWAWRDGATLLELYDVDDPADATRVDALQIQGYLIDSRRIDDILYLVTRATPSIEGLINAPQTDEDRATNQTLIDAASLDELLPSIVDDNGAVQALVDAEDCFIPEAEETELRYPSLVTISAINLRDTADIKSVCMAENAYGIYVSKEAMYLVSNQYSDGGGDGVLELLAPPSTTKFHKFSFTTAGPEYRGTGTVEGQLTTGDPAFRMGEYEGQLVVITSDSFNSGHKLTMLEEGEDFKLVNVGELPNSQQPEVIGKEGEAIYATRIIGNRAYIVTFLVTDPVYVIDLEDLAILGELEIPGFSSYLHPVTENLLLGIGKSAVVENGQVFFQGLKLQLFDVSDPTNPVSSSEVSIGLRGTDSSLFYDVHALAYVRDFEQGTDRLALPIRVHGDGVQVDPETPASTVYDFSHRGLYLFELDKNSASINPMGAIRLQEEDACSISRERGFIADEAVHFFLSNRILSGFWASPDQISELNLSEDDQICLVDTVSIAISDENPAANASSITSFEECVAAGHSTDLSYPGTCTTPDGSIFTEDTELVIPPAIPPGQSPGDSGDDSNTVCTMDAKACPDGSFVGRIPPSCEFALCPNE